MIIHTIIFHPKKRLIIIDDYNITMMIDGYYHSNSNIFCLLTVDDQDLIIFHPKKNDLYI